MIFIIVGAKNRVKNCIMKFCFAANPLQMLCAAADDKAHLQGNEKGQ